MVPPNRDLRYRLVGGLVSRGNAVERRVERACLCPRLRAVAALANRSGGAGGIGDPDDHGVRSGRGRVGRPDRHRLLHACLAPGRLGRGGAAARSLAARQWWRGRADALEPSARRVDHDAGAAIVRRSADRGSPALGRRRDWPREFAVSPLGDAASGTRHRRPRRAAARRGRAGAVRAGHHGLWRAGTGRPPRVRRRRGDRDAGAGVGERCRRRAAPRSHAGGRDRRSWRVAEPRGAAVRAVRLGGGAVARCRARPSAGRARRGLRAGVRAGGGRRHPDRSVAVGQIRCRGRPAVASVSRTRRADARRRRAGAPVGAATGLAVAGGRRGGHRRRRRGGFVGGPPSDHPARAPTASSRPRRGRASGSTSTR